MNKKLSKRRLSIITGALAIAGMTLVQAMPGRAVSFSTPDGVEGTPKMETSGGASRSGGQCTPGVVVKPEEAIAPLVPNTKLGLTVAERPNFFAYIPETTAKEAAFSLQDEEQNLVYQTRISLPSKAGIVRISIPEEVEALEVGKDYRWFVEVLCTGEDFDPDNPLADGWVRRTEKNPMLQSKLEQASTNLERAMAYAEAGIWHETASMLVEARQLQPEDSNDWELHWQELLTSVGLEAIATQPLAY